MGPRAEVIPCGGGSGAVDPIYSISLSEGMTQLGEDFPVTLIADDYKSKAKEIQAADAVVVSVGFDKKTEREDHDRTFTLPEGQDELIEFALANNDNVIVVVYSGGGIDMSRWQDKVSAIVMGWYPGQEGGTALAEIISGKISPSGKLPISIENAWEDNPVHDSYYDRRNVPHKRIEYKEGIFVGYRGYDRNGVAPRYPFGFGMSYTTFSYSGMKVEKLEGDIVNVSFDITNTGKMDAWETSQIYVSDKTASVPRPVKELKGYDKVYIPKGKTVRVSVDLDSEAFSFYDVKTHGFVVEPGDFTIYVGPSSAELPLKADVTLE